MRSLSFTFLACIVACNAGTADEYRGRFTPDAEYVLSGKLAVDLPPLPDVPFSLEAPGFREDLLSQAPPVGVHPRVVLSPSDIDEIKANIAKGEDADVTFRVCFRELRNKAAKPKPMREDFGNAPWGGIGVIAAKGLLALLTDDQVLGREAAEWTVRHAQYLEPRIGLLNSHPDARAFKDNFYYFSRAGVRVGGLDYATAYREGGADRVRELAEERVEFFAEDNQWAYTSLGAEYDYCEPFMAAAQRDYVRSVISRATSGKYTTGMEIPGHFFINNHMSMGAEFYTLLLSIEGEKGFDEKGVGSLLPERPGGCYAQKTPDPFFDVRCVGYFRAVQAGDYAFRTDPSGGNRLTIGKQVVACANIQGCEPVDLLHLEPGLYPLEFVNLFGSGELRVRSPGSDEFRPAVPGQLACEAKQAGLPDTRGPVAVIDFENINVPSPQPAQRDSGGEGRVRGNGFVAVQSERALTARLSGAEPVATPFGQGVAFTGENPYLELSGLQWPAPACTVSMRLKRGKSGDSLAFRGMPNKFQARLRSKDAVWAAYHRSPDAVQIQAGEKAANNEWFHLTVTYGDWVKVYVDGKLIGSRIVDPSAMYPGSSAYPASILFMEHETDGQLDEVRIFNRVLSESEIRALAAS